MDAWGHTLTPLTAAEIDYFRRRRAQMHEDSPHGPDCRRCGIGSCTMGRRDHLSDATHRLAYRYITGRRGRVGLAERLVCDAHAAKYRGPA